MSTRPRTFIIGLGLALVLAIPARGQLDELDTIGATTGVARLSAIVKEALVGEPPPGVTVEKLPGGLLKVAVPMPGAERRLRPKARVLYNLARLVNLFEPDLLGDTVSYDVAPIEQLDYYLGWVTLHVGERDVEARSQLKTRGPGPDVNQTEFLAYDAGALNLFFLLVPDGFDAGIHQFDVKVNGAKPSKMKGHFCAGCTAPE